MKSLDTLSHFAKLQYIEKYWVKTVPTDYPVDPTIEISTQFDSEDDRQAVIEMESQIGSEESVVTAALPENTFVSNYLGTFNITNIVDDGSQEDDIPRKVLLSPVKVDEDNDGVMGVVAMHYNSDTSKWEAVEDAAIEDGYVYGTLSNFSPVSVFTYRKDLEVKEGYLWKGLIAVYANGNPVRVYTTEDNKKVIENKITGKQYELTSTETVLFGGTSDGTVVKNTNIAVEAGEYPSLDIKAGSQSPKVQTINESINVAITDATIRCLSGASGAVHVDEINFNLKNVKMSWLGAGESITYLVSGNTDANAGLTPETVDLNAKMWVKKVNMTIDNITTTLLYGAANTGMTYTKEVNVDVKNSNVEYYLACASNGRTGVVNFNISNSTGDIVQSNNRGIVEECNIKINNSTLTHVFVCGDATDSTVTGVTKFVNMDIGAGTYGLYLGTQGGVELTKDVANETVGKVKYSRSAQITFADNVKGVLGDKLVQK